MVKLPQQRCGETTFVSSVAIGSMTCFKSIPIGFYSCKLLLLNSTSCNALIYTNSRCTVLEKLDTGAKSSPKNSPAIYMIRLTHGIDDCRNDIAGISDEHDTSDISKEVVSSWQELPLLGLVMSVTKDWLEANRHEVNAVTSNFHCYCRAHNYTFVSI